MTMSEEFEQPVSKRQKRDGHIKGDSSRGSRLFAPFRTIGLVSPTRVPFTSVPLGKTTFQITTSIGRSLQTYDLRKGLSLVFLSRPQCPEEITATFAYKDRVYAAWGGGEVGANKGIWIFKRGRKIAELDLQDSVLQTVNQILIFGSWIIASGSEAVEIWKNDVYEHYTTILPSSRPSVNTVQIFSGRICTLPTFLNKIFVGRRDGNVDIYNVSTGRLVHTLLSPSISCGMVTAILPASAISLLAVAYADGSLIIFDVETDEELIQLHDRSGHPITSITFRTDGIGAGEYGREDGVMATSSTESGDITLWDLRRGGKVVGIVRGAHEVTKSKSSGITRIEYLPGQPVIISTGMDNALRSWVFDREPDSPLPRILHSRSGHAAPVTRLKFLPAATDGSEAAGKWLLSAAHDRSLWGFSLRKDVQNAELSQGHIKHKAKKIGHVMDDLSGVEDFKAPPIIEIACSLNRDGGMGAVGGPVWTNTSTSRAEEANLTGWESIVTAHENDRFARTWFWGRRKAGRWKFETSDHQAVTSVALTTCGTFALVGSAQGSIDRFNLQSGLHRQRYPSPLKPVQAKSLQKAQLEKDQIMNLPRGHRDNITGIVVDNLNTTLVSSSLDETVKFWDFNNGRLIHEIMFDGHSAVAMRYNSVSGLIALSCDDLCIRVVDMDTKRTVRELWGSVGQVLDHCFSHDGRWIVTCSMDSVIRVFDLSTGHLIDAFKCSTSTNVAFSSTGEFLATTHAGSLGINIWSNKSLFGYISTRKVDEDTGILDLTSGTDFDAQVSLDMDSNSDESNPTLDGINGYSNIEQLDASLLTLSLAPSSRWQTLLNLETIRQRNKPIQPPEKPKAAPFFLGSSIAKDSGTQAAISLDKAPNGEIEQERSRISRLTSQGTQDSRLTELLSNIELNETLNPTAVTEYLIALSPSAADLEIRSLTINEMPSFVRIMTEQIKRRKYFELVNTWMSVFLKLHGDFIAGDEKLRHQVLHWRHCMEREEQRLTSLVGYTKGVVEFLRSVR